MLLFALERAKAEGVAVIMDKAYKGNIMRKLIFDLQIIPVVYPKRIAFQFGYTAERCTKAL